MRRGVSLTEIVVVTVVLGILAALLAPQVSKSAYNSRLNQTTFRLQTIRTAILKHQQRHDEPPADLAALTAAEGGASALLPEIPLDSMGNSRAVEIVASPEPIRIGGEVMTGGWIYNRRTGEVRVNLGAHRDL